MGLANAPWIAVAALRMFFTDEHWTRFKREKNNPEFAQGLNVESIILYYENDRLIFSKKNKGFELHVFILEFVYSPIAIVWFHP